jgi:hypothetical protein
MQESHLFEYAVIRIVPHVEREEFMNVGVILYCSKQKFLHSVFELNEARLKALCEKLDLEEVKEHIASFERICGGDPEAGPIGKLPIAERFRWLTATRSTVLQTSKVHPGLSADASKTLLHLHEQLVLVCN